MRGTTAGYQGCGEGPAGAIWFVGPSSPRCHCRQTSGGPPGWLCHQTKLHSALLPGRSPGWPWWSFSLGLEPCPLWRGSLRSAPRLSTPALAGGQSWDDCEVPAQGRLLQMPAPAGLVLAWCPFPQEQEESRGGHDPWGAPRTIQRQELGFGLLQEFWNVALEVCRSRCSKASSHVSGQRDSRHLLSGSLWSDALLVPGEGVGKQRRRRARGQCCGLVRGLQHLGSLVPLGGRTGRVSPWLSVNEGSCFSGRVITILACFILSSASVEFLLCA